MIPSLEDEFIGNFYNIYFLYLSQINYSTCSGH